eukprot:GHVP01031178.1.p1 GENE.GHVP01031178.1~~GHVP01031178.1.p1  ORF type:complete len:1103 (+),score=169.50 GHVP01031178.1:113-3421(+)
MDHQNLNISRLRKSFEPPEFTPKSVQGPPGATAASGFPILDSLKKSPGTDRQGSHRSAWPALDYHSMENMIQYSTPSWPLLKKTSLVSPTFVLQDPPDEDYIGCSTSSQIADKNPACSHRSALGFGLKNPQIPFPKPFRIIKDFVVYQDSIFRQIKRSQDESGLQHPNFDIRSSSAQPSHPTPHIVNMLHVHHTPYTGAQKNLYIDGTEICSDLVSEEYESVANESEICLLMEAKRKDALDKKELLPHPRRCLKFIILIEQTTVARYSPHIVRQHGILFITLPDWLIAEFQNLSQSFSTPFPCQAVMQNTIRVRVNFTKDMQPDEWSLYLDEQTNNRRLENPNFHLPDAFSNAAIDEDGAIDLSCSSEDYFEDMRHFIVPNVTCVDVGIHISHVSPYQSQSHHLILQLAQIIAYPFKKPQHVAYTNPSAQQYPMSSSDGWSSEVDANSLYQNQGSYHLDHQNSFPSQIHSDSFLEQVDPHLMSHQVSQSTRGLVRPTYSYLPNYGVSNEEPNLGSDRYTQLLESRAAMIGQEGRYHLPAVGDSSSMHYDTNLSRNPVSTNTQESGGLVYFDEPPNINNIQPPALKEDYYYPDQWQLQWQLASRRSETLAARPRASSVALLAKSNNNQSVQFAKVPRITNFNIQDVVSWPMDSGKFGSERRWEGLVTDIYTSEETGSSVCDVFLDKSKHPFTYNRERKAIPLSVLRRMHRGKPQISHFPRLASDDFSIKPDSINGTLCFFWDLEATGLDTSVDDITQIGCVCRLFRHNEWWNPIEEIDTLSDTFSRYVITSKAIPSDVIGLTGITNDILNSLGVSFHDALSDWQTWVLKFRPRFPKCPIWFIAHNGNGFDLPLLLTQEERRCCQNAGTFLSEIGVTGLVDTVILSRRLKWPPDSQEEGISIRHSKIKPDQKRSHRLQDLYQDIMHEVMPGRHDALGDVVGLAALMTKEPFLSAWRTMKIGWTTNEFLSSPNQKKKRDFESGQYRRGSSYPTSHTESTFQFTEEAPAVSHIEMKPGETTYKTDLQQPYSSGHPFTEPDINHLHLPIITEARNDLKIPEIDSAKQVADAQRKAALRSRAMQLQSGTRLSADEAAEIAKAHGQRIN